MAGDRAARGQRTISCKLALIYLCVCWATTLTLGQSTLDDAFTTTTTTTTSSSSSSSDGEEATSLAPTTTERTSNAIPEAEHANSQLKKYGGKKLDSATQPDQLEKPYPYLKKDKDLDKDNAIRQAKRSGQADSLAVNGTLQLSLSPTTTTSSITTTSSTTDLTVASTLPEDEPSTTLSAQQPDDQTTTIQPTSEATTLLTDKSPVAETETESLPIMTTQPMLSTTPALSTSSLSSASSSSQTEASTSSLSSTSSSSQTETSSLAISESNAPTTVTESTNTLLPDISTTPLEQEQSTIITLAPATLPPATIATTPEPTLQPLSTESAPATSTPMPTTIASPPVTTVTLPSTTTTTTTTTTTPTATTTTTSTTTTAKPSTSFISPRNTAAAAATTTAITSEPFSAITTWQEETTEPFSPTPSPEEVTLLVRIVLEGSWQDVCSKLPILRQSLTDLLNTSNDKSISSRQIIFHQTQCSDSLSPTSLLTDSQLTPVLVYVVDENGSFDAKLTKLLPRLHESSPIDFPLKIHSVSLVPEADSGNAIAVVIVSCVAFVCLILLAGLLFIMRKRQGRFNYGERCRPVSLDAYSLDSVSAYNSVRRSKAVVRSSKRSYGNPAFEDSSVTPTHPLNFAGIGTFCQDNNAVAEEFTGIPQIHSKIDELPPGAEIKNRYANVIPLPETRVPLQRINNEPLSEYINASYVRGPKNATKYYIACQGPTEATVADFWRMIWEQQCKVIIMLTDLVENGVDKCTEYIPPLEVSDCHRLYGDYQVTLKKREAKEKYAISTLHLKNLENNTFREVSHIWYLWPASGVPTDAAGLIAVLLEARALQRGAAGPILVHCSPGTGRTGTLIALDLCIRQYEVTRTVDVPRVVYTIRRDRAGAVQTREQYLFIYKGLNLYASKLAGGGIDST